MPGDKYRFCYYAKRKNLVFEIADPAVPYDVLVLSAGADISLWSRYPKQHTRIVFDYVNSYLLEPRLSLRRLFRGTAKFLLRHNRYLVLDHCDAIRRMCELADAVVCASLEQTKQIQDLCNNIHVVPDCYEDLFRAPKSSYLRSEVTNLVWQGFPENLRFFSELTGVFERIQKTQKIVFHLVTTPEYGRYLGRKVGKGQTLSLARKLFKNVHLYSWNEDICSSIITSCDLALIPLPLNDPVEAGKPENKLILFWRLGMPTIVSATPAYSRVMRQCGLAMDCRTDQEWKDVLLHYMMDEKARMLAGERAKAFASTYFGEQAILKQWDAVFSSISG